MTLSKQHATPAPGAYVTIRPVFLDEDSEPEFEFDRHLPSQSQHYRFLGGVRELSPQTLKTFCDSDNHHQAMAFVATVNENGKETEVGVSRFAPDTTEEVREIAVAVANDWQDKGLDTLLVTQLLYFARRQGIKNLYSVDVADNTPLRQLANDLGMRAEQNPDDANEVIYSLAL